MIKPVRQAGFLLLCILTGLIAGLGAIVDLAEKTGKDEVAARGKIVTEPAKLFEHHDDKRDDIETALKDRRAKFESYQDRIIQYRFALMAKMSREEWTKVFPEEQQPLPENKKGQ